MLFQDFCNRLVDRGRARDIAEVCRNFGNPVAMSTEIFGTKLDHSLVAARIFRLVRVHKTLSRPHSLVSVHVHESDVGSASD